MHQTFADFCQYDKIAKLIIHKNSVSSKGLVEHCENAILKISTFRNREIKMQQKYNVNVKNIYVESSNQMQS